MDPRKTLVIADFEDLLRGVKQASTLERQLPPARFAAKTLAWSSGDLPAPAEPAVVIGRTVIASGEPRSLALAKTQVWRREVTVEAQEGSVNGERERAQVHVDESVMQHLSAELWAGQARQSARMTVTTVRQSIVDTRSAFVVETDRGTRPTPIATEVYEPPQIPRRFQLPSVKAIRIACAVVCVGCAALVGSATLRGSGARERASTTEPKPASTAAPLAAISSKSSEPAQVETPNDSSSAAESFVAPRAAVDALIAGKHQLAVARYRALARSNPSDPVYETAARILEEAQQRIAE